MNSNPATLPEILAEARAVGRHAANLDVDLRHGISIDDRIHHLGDDTGDLVTSAYRSGGAADAVDVIDAYLSAYNRGRACGQVAPLAPAAAIANLQWAIRPGGITEPEQNAVRAEFRARHVL